MTADLQSTPAGSKPSRFWQWARLLFRWARISALTIILFAVAVLLWCNYVGVPQAISGLITAQLREKRINIEFSKVRLRGFRQVIARDLRFTHSASNEFPRFDARAAELLLDSRKLRRGEIELSGLRLEEGRLLIPIHATNEAPRFLTVSNVATEVDFLPGDTVRVNSISMEALGAKAEAAGLLRNISKYPRPARGTGGGAGWEHWKRELREITDLAETLQFSETPVISARIAGDAADLPGLRGNITVTAGPARSDWGSFNRLRIVSGIFNESTNVAGRFQLDVEGFRSRWGSATEGRIDGETLWSADMDQLQTNLLSFSVSGFRSRWGRADRVSSELSSWRETNGGGLRTTLAARTTPLEGRDFNLGATELAANLSHALPFPSPAAWFRRLLHGAPTGPVGSAVTGDWRLRASGTMFARTSFDALDLSGGIHPNTNASPGASLFSQARIPWRLSVSNVLSEEIAIGTLGGAGEWDWPRFALTRLEAGLYGGKLAGSAEIDLPSGQVNASAEGDFDYKRIARLLDRPVQRWLDQFSWTRAPFIQANIAFKLPAWTNSWAEAENEMLSTIKINGLLKGAANYRQIPIQNAEGRFHFSDFTWRLPDFLITRPEGTARLDYTGNVSNGDFSCRLELRLDPGILRSLVAEEERAGFDLVRFPEPPWLAGEAKGNWDRKEEITFKGRFAATNFMVRGKEITDVSGELAYSNLVIECWNVSAHLGTGTVRAPFLRVDFPAEVMLVTNVVSTADPYYAMFIVGPDAYEAIDPYRFGLPPTVRVNGFVPLKRVSKADLWFDVAGHEFKFWKFNLPHLTGTVHWRADELWITNVAASFYNGRAAWNGYFLIHDEPNDVDDNADFRFHGTATDADLKSLVADVFGQTNHMEGLFSGDLVITSANSENTNSWNGYGTASLRDGFLWNVPVFGVFTPVLDAVVPGASMSRVTSGQGTFTITNSVIHTRDLQVRTKAFRLNYKGSVDLAGTLDALVEAEIFRDAWLVGKVFSMMLWPVSKTFEARVSGNAEEPKTQLRFFPRFLLAPFKALNGASSSEKSKTSRPPPAIE